MSTQRPPLDVQAARAEADGLMFGALRTLSPDDPVFGDPKVAEAVAKVATHQQIADGTVGTPEWKARLLDLQRAADETVRECADLRGLHVRDAVSAAIERAAARRAEALQEAGRVLARMREAGYAVRAVYRRPDWTLVIDPPLSEVRQRQVDELRPLLVDLLGDLAKCAACGINLARPGGDRCGFCREPEKIRA